MPFLSTLLCFGILLLTPLDLIFPFLQQHTCWVLMDVTIKDSLLSTFWQLGQ